MIRYDNLDTVNKIVILPLKDLSLWSGRINENVVLNLTWRWLSCNEFVVSRWPVLCYWNFLSKKKKESLLLSPVMLSFLQCGWFSSLIIALTQQCFISFSWMTKCFVQMVMHVRSETSSAASLLAHNGIGGEWWQCLGIILKLPEGYMIANCLELKESVFVFNCCLIEKKQLV